MTQETNGTKGLRISQLAKRAGVSIPTIKHYLREGLLPRPIKTGRTMSYYSEECVDRILLIKRLQTERFFPLSMVKKIIDSGTSIEGELALGDALMNIPAASSVPEAIPRKKVARHTGYSLKKIDRLESAGLIRPRTTQHGKEYDAADCQIISLVRQREDAGLPFDYSVEMMSIYRKYINQIVVEDAKLFVRRMIRNASAEDAARYIREGDKALGAFMPILKAKLVVENAKKTVDALNSTADSIAESVRFRWLAKTRSSTGDSSRSDKSDLRRWLISAGRQVRSRHEPGNPNLVELARGFRELGGGDFKKSLVHFNRIAASDKEYPLVAALSGLAHIGLIPSAAGLLQSLQIITDALSCFDASRSDTRDADTDPLISYLRGVGLALIPGIFDTHAMAAADLTRVAESEKEGSSRDASIGTSRSFSRELRLKASYFLVQMHMRDGQDKRAKDIAKLMKSEGRNSFYGRWAGKQFKEINENFHSVGNDKNA